MYFDYSLRTLWNILKYLLAILLVIAFFAGIIIADTFPVSTTSEIYTCTISSYNGYEPGDNILSGNDYGMTITYIDKSGNSQNITTPSFILTAEYSIFANTGTNLNCEISSKKYFFGKKEAQVTRIWQ